MPTLVEYAYASLAAETCCGLRMQLGISVFSDMTDEEFRAGYLGQKSSSDPMLRSAQAPMTTAAFARAAAGLADTVSDALRRRLLCISGPC